MKLKKSSLKKKISTATHSSHHILAFITSQVTVISWKPHEVDWSFEETSSAKELCVTGTNYLTTWSTLVQLTRSRIAWIESGATTVRAELLARQPQVQVQVHNGAIMFSQCRASAEMEDGPVVGHSCWASNGNPARCHHQLKSRAGLFYRLNFAILPS